MGFQVVGEEVIHWPDPMWLHDGVIVIQKCKQGFTREELCLHCLQCLLLAQREQRRHEGVALFPAPCLEYRMVLASSIMPDVL